MTALYSLPTRSLRSWLEVMTAHLLVQGMKPECYSVVASWQKKVWSLLKSAALRERRGLRAAAQKRSSQGMLFVQPLSVFRAVQSLSSPLLLALRGLWLSKSRALVHAGSALGFAAQLAVRKVAML